MAGGFMAQVLFIHSLFRRCASVALILAVLAIAPASEARDPQFKPALFKKIYVPGGYDSNDHVQVVGEGTFPGTCYRPANVEVRIDRPQKRIFVSPAAYEYPGDCASASLPFHRTVEVGVLAAGSWQVLQEANGSKLGEINVRPALVETADDFEYAPVTQAFFRQEPNALQVLLTGNFISNCSQLVDLQLTIEPEVLVVQPIAKTEVRNGCMSGEFPFSSWTAIDFLQPKRYLLHVRSLNGNAINQLVDMHETAPVRRRFTPRVRQLSKWIPPSF